MKISKKKSNIIQIVVLSVAFIVVCTLFFSLSRSTTDKPTESPGTVAPKTFYLVVNGQKVVDQCTADLSSNLNVDVVSDVDKYGYSVCSNVTPEANAFMFSTDKAPYIFWGDGNYDYTAGFAIAANGNNLTVSATTISEVLTKRFNSTTFTYNEKRPTEGFPYFVLKVSCGTKNISVLLTMPN